MRSEIAIALLRKIYSIKTFVESENFQQELYRNVILSFPAAGSENPKFNFSIIEAAFALFHSLSAKFSTATGFLIGKPLIVTFQPSELNKFKSDEGKFNALTSRLQFISTNADIFVQKYLEIKTNLKSLGKLNDSQVSDVRLATDAIVTGKNCLYYSRIFQGGNFAKEIHQSDFRGTRRHCSFQDLVYIRMTPNLLVNFEGMIMVISINLGEMIEGRVAPLLIAAVKLLFS